MNFLNERWENFISDAHISYKEYVKDSFKFYKDFIEFIGCKLNIISFDKSKEINRILNTKQQLQHEFWNRKAGTTPFPWKKIYNNKYW